MAVGRDRDEAGRPRQARPRDALGRPLPYGTPGVVPVPEEALPPQETVRVAQQLLGEGRPFAAHEVFEARWKAAPAGERDLWQGLAQLAVGITHARRGNAAGARALVDRGTGRLERYAVTGGPTYGLDVAAMRREAEAAVAHATNTAASETGVANAVPIGERPPDVPAPVEDPCSG